MLLPFLSSRICAASNGFGTLHVYRHDGAYPNLIEMKVLISVLFGHAPFMI